MNSNETYEIDKCGGLTLIIGGAYQGKLTYAVQRLGFNAAAVLDLAAAQCPEANVFDSVIGGNSSVYIHFEALTQKIAAEYADRCAMMFDGDLVSCDFPHEFFSGNSFYTTASNRMSRHVFEDAITCQDVIALCGANLM